MIVARPAGRDAGSDRVELDEGVGDLAGGRTVLSPQGRGVGRSADPPIWSGDHQRRAGQLAASSPTTPPRAVVRPRSPQHSCWPGRVRPAGSPGRTSAAELPAPVPWHRSGPAGPPPHRSSTDSASAVQSQLFGPGSSSRTSCRIISPPAARPRATEAPKECPITRSIGRSASSAATQAAATSGVRARSARGLAPWQGRSGALTRHPASASAGPTCHQVAEDEVVPCKSSARRSAPPQDRQRRNREAVVMAASMAVTRPYSAQRGALS